MSVYDNYSSCAESQCAALLIELDGRIAGCSLSAMALLGRQSEGLSGCAVSALIPGLPFMPETPGYNLAYAVFHATDGQRLRRTALLPDGQPLPVEIALGSLTTNGHRCIALTLRPSASSNRQ